MREQLIKALLAHAQGDIQKHVANVEVYLTNPAGIGEHSNIVEAIEQELDMIAKYQDQIDINILDKIETDIIDRVKQVPIQKFLQSGFR